MQFFKIPEIIPNIINGEIKFSITGNTFDNINPNNGEVICKASRSKKEDIDIAVKYAKDSQKKWGETNPVKRGSILFD